MSVIVHFCWLHSYLCLKYDVSEVAVFTISSGAVHSNVLFAPVFFTQLPMRRMRICFTGVFFLFFFSVRHKIPDNRSREQLNGFS